MRVILVIVFCFCASGVYAGARDTITDVYKGMLPAKGCKGIATILSLRHVKYADDGSFTLTEQYCNNPKANVITGTWTVLRGDASDENATVIELWDEVAKRGLRHYLRLKGGSIKMLDNDLRAIKAKGNYILKKIK